MSRSSIFAVLGWLALAVGLLARENAVERPSVTTPKRAWAASTVKLPTVENGRVTRSIQAEELTVRLDLQDQVISVHAPQSQSWRLQGEFQPGDTVSVKAGSAALMRGRERLATVTKGHLLSVVEVKEGWLSVSAPQAGKTRTGWVLAKDVTFVSAEPVLQPTIPPSAPGQTVSGAMLLQKAKQFDDGLYAAVELAAQEGAGTFAGKAPLLRALAEKLASSDTSASNSAARIVFGAGKLGGTGVRVPDRLSAEADREVRSFLANPARSKPLGFYTWSDGLTAIFRQDRMLQSPLEDPASVESLAKLLREDGRARATYESYLQLVSRLTNPLVGGDLRSMLRAESGTPPAGSPVSFFPPSRSHEAELIKRLYGDKSIPEGFDLMNELVTRIVAGEIDLAPQQDSGWYDYQTWSLQPLVLPEGTPEAKHLKLDDRYRKLLVELFKGALALARETHIKQLELPPAAAEAPEPEKPKPKVYIHPDLSVEPLATVYLRRAQSYRFIRQVLEETFGGEALSKLHRLTAAGPVQPNLAEELQTMEALFLGAYMTVFQQLGLVPEAKPGDGSGQAAADTQRFLDWAANLDHDADVSQDVRMMVPVFYDLERKKTKVWMFLGWNPQVVGFEFAVAPKAMVFDQSGHEVAADRVEMHFHGQWNEMAYPVMAEAYVDKLLDRQEFRSHCDQYRTRSAILRNLQ